MSRTIGLGIFTSAFLRNFGSALTHGYDVLNVDVAPAREPLAPFLKVDLTDLGQTFEALHGATAVVHGEAPEADISPPT